MLSEAKHQGRFFTTLANDNYSSGHDITPLHKHALHGLDFAQELNLRLPKQIVVVREWLQGELLDAVWDTSSGKH